MKKIYLFVLIICLSFGASAQVELELHFPVSEVKQGSLQEATLELDSSSLQNFEIQKLKGSSPGELVYFHKLSPLIRNNGNFTSEVSVIFLKKPENDSLLFKVNEQEVRLSWNQVSVLPTEAPKSLIFESFNVPGRKRVLIWILVFLIIGASVAGVMYFRNVSRKSQSAKVKRAELKDKILSARNYQEIVEVWQNKFMYQKEFPHTAPAFKNFEKTFFKFSFKPAQTESEKEEVIRAYRIFVNEVQEGFNGV